MSEKKKKKKPHIWSFALPTVVAASLEIQLAYRLIEDPARQSPADHVPLRLHLQPSRPVTTIGIPLSLWFTTGCSWWFWV
jgi:hypothetical protein